MAELVSKKIFDKLIEDSPRPADDQFERVVIELGHKEIVLLSLRANDLDITLNKYINTILLETITEVKEDGDTLRDRVFDPARLTNQEGK